MAFIAPTPLLSATATRTTFHTPLPHTRRSTPSLRHATLRTAPRRAALMMATGIYFASTTGNTEEVAGLVHAEMGDDCADPLDLELDHGPLMAAQDVLVVGVPTWNTGADTERSGTTWDEFILGPLKDMDMKGKKVAVFGLGDAVDYEDNFCDAIEEIHDAFEAQGAKMVGYVDSGYIDFEESKSVRDGKFLGLALDMIHQGEEGEAMIKDWCAQIKKETA